ncbi:MAG TPA: hypothetical protein VF648_21390 [Pyrinomonadaceae bacterium]|jgi:hypothetical protein
MTNRTEILAALIRLPESERAEFLASLTVEQLAEVGSLLCGFLERCAAQMESEIARQNEKPDCVKSFEQSPKMRRYSVKLDEAEILAG